MHYMNLGMGLLLIFVGWLTFRYPKFINPYGGMPPERQALVNIDGLKKATGLTLGIAGLLLIVLFFLGIFHVVNEVLAVDAMTVIVLAMLIPLFIAMKKYNGFGRDASGSSYFGHRLGTGSKIAIIIVPLTMLIVLALILVSAKPAVITAEEDRISINGFYGKEIPYSDIISVEILDEMPAMQMRVNGSSIGNINKGHYLTKEGEKCLLFVTYNGGPYIEIRTSDKLIYMNCASKEKTLEVISRLQESIGQSDTSGR